MLLTIYFRGLSKKLTVGSTPDPDRDLKNFPKLFNLR